MLLQNYTNDEQLIAESWLEIAENYAEEGRHYHTLQHLESMLEQLKSVRSAIKNWNATLFSLYYHDMVYHPQQADNEEKSAALAEKRMLSIAVPDEIIAVTKEQILATSSHQASAWPDTNYFTDADLAVLGKPWEIYARYYQNIRKEYSVYPDERYIPGRKKVLAHFLAMPRIFKTEYFYQKLEDGARKNIQRELQLL